MNKNRLRISETVWFWAICSILFAVIIHVLFHWENGPKWLVAKWGAGDILTYASTVALGLLALWQNQRFKEENDSAQLRLERLTEQANEQTLINKIIEIEAEKLSRTREAINSFSNICDPVLSFNNMLGYGTSSEQHLHESKKRCAIQKQKIDEAFLELLRTLGVEYTVEKTFNNPFLAEVVRYKEATIDAIRKTAEMITNNDVTVPDEQLVSLYEERAAFRESRDGFIRHREDIINCIIYENLPVCEIKALVSGEYASYRDCSEEVSCNT